jgi:hypothetical protein
MVVVLLLIAAGITAIVLLLNIFVITGDRSRSDKFVREWALENHLQLVSISRRITTSSLYYSKGRTTRTFDFRVIDETQKHREGEIVIGISANEDPVVERLSWHD